MEDAVIHGHVIDPIHPRRAYPGETSAYDRLDKHLDKTSRRNSCTPVGGEFVSHERHPGNFDYDLTSFEIFAEKLLK